MVSILFGEGERRGRREEMEAGKDREAESDREGGEEKR